jgi:predicted RecB family nuclease
VEPKEVRQLKDLAGIGPRMLEDFRDLGVDSVDALARQNPQELYDRLSGQKGVRMDPCVLDTFTCAIAQAKDPQLPADQCNWWYWSRVRKGQIPAPGKPQASARRGR